MVWWSACEARRTQPEVELRHHSRAVARWTCDGRILAGKEFQRLFALGHLQLAVATLVEVAKEEGGVQLCEARLVQPLGLTARVLGELNRNVVTRPLLHIRECLL